MKTLQFTMLVILITVLNRLNMMNLNTRLSKFDDMRSQVEELHAWERYRGLNVVDGCSDCLDNSCENCVFTDEYFRETFGPDGKKFDVLRDVDEPFEYEDNGDNSTNTILLLRLENEVLRERMDELIQAFESGLDIDHDDMLAYVYQTYGDWPNAKEDK